MRGIIADRGKRKFAKWLETAVTHGAVGRRTWVDPFAPPVENYAAAELEDEIGRVAIKAVRYLMPDPAGTLVFDGDPAKYRYATTQEIDDAAADPQGALAPSADIEFEFEIPVNTINGEQVSQIGLFIGSTTSVPGFATYPAQVTQVGQPIYLLNIPSDPIYADKLFNRRVRLNASN